MIQDELSKINEKFMFNVCKCSTSDFWIENEKKEMRPYKKIENDDIFKYTRGPEKCMICQTELLFSHPYTIQELVNIGRRTVQINLKAQYDDFQEAKI